METEMKDGRPAFFAKDRKTWRKWLEKNGRTEPRIWLIMYHKSAETQGVSRIDSVKEALCFGWIDSLTKKRDAESYYVTFSPRNKNSNWSAINIGYVRELLREGLMTEDGQRLIDIAKEKGKWQDVSAQDDRVRTTNTRQT